MDERERFAMNPVNLDIPRSRFHRPHSHKTTFNVGDVIPIYVDADILPGDTISMDTSKVVRLQTPINPIMDNIYLDTYWFFIPHRLVWDHWKNFMGENTESAWIPETEYTVPQLIAPDGGWNAGTIADYFGIPTGVDNFSVSALPFRAYALVMNEWFRSTALTDPVVVTTGDYNNYGSNQDDYVTCTELGSLPFKAAKFHDYFTAALPSPQLGPDVQIPAPDMQPLPVYATPQSHPPGKSDWYNRAYGLYGSDGLSTTYNLFLQDNTSPATSNAEFRRANGTSYSNGSFSPMNLWSYPSSDGSSPFSMPSINQFRMAFQIQRYYERLARGGQRYIEMIKSFFGVTSPDARLQRPEYLGGNRIPLNISQVLQQSATQEESPLGATGAFSLTTDSHSDFTHSFVEHGTLLGVCVARYNHSYQQGLERQWSRKTRFDYYFPVFANLGEQAILNKEIYLSQQTGSYDDESNLNNQVFGYQERWAEYRYKPSRVSGEMRSNSDITLDSWHLADNYASQPFLSDSWIREDPVTIDRVIAVTSRVANQLFMDVYFNETATRPMPMYSIPGLIDHY